MTQQSSTTDSSRRVQTVLAPVLFVLGYTVGYFFVVHLVPADIPDAAVGLAVGLAVMMFGMLASTRVV